MEPEKAPPVENLPEGVPKGTVGLLPTRESLWGKVCSFSPGSWSRGAGLPRRRKNRPTATLCHLLDEQASLGVSGSSEREWSLLRMQTACSQSLCNSESLRES